MSRVVVKFGEYRNEAVMNREFTLVKGFQTGKKGGYITVKNDGDFPNPAKNIRIKVNNISDFEFLSGEEPMTNNVVEMTHQETDDEAMDRIATRFEILDEMSKACINGDVRAMIVSGPPGVGKSYGVEQQMEKASLFDRLSSKRSRYDIVKGAITPIGLYAKLFKYSDAGSVLVFDDCDSVFGDELALNILKAALDSGKKRKICWNSDSSLLRREDIPDSFEFKGTIIFITNLKFENVRSKKIQDHLAALESRCHFLDLTIDTDRDKVLRIRQVARDADLFESYGFDDNGAEIMEFVEKNAGKLRELSIRMALKIADLKKISNRWELLAENTVMKRG